MLKFSIITVTYNAGRWLERTIKSVESQDYPAVEHLIIDGNSQDNTLELVHHYQERNSRADIRHEIICRSEPDEGLYDAMNKGILLATGHYVLFLNAGDTFDHDHILSDVAGQIPQSQQIPTLDEDDEMDDEAEMPNTDAPWLKRLPAVLYGHTDIVDETGNFVRHRRLSPPEVLTWHSFREGMLVCHQAFFARIDLARANLYDLRWRLSADFDWCIRIMRQGEREPSPLHNLHTIVCRYLEGGVSVQQHRASLIERFRIMCRHYGYITTIGRHLWFVIRAAIKK